MKKREAPAEAEPTTEEKLLVAITDLSAAIREQKR
jgi:hypothetical protein